MRLPVLCAIALLTVADTAHAYLAVEPVREVLRGASADVRACVTSQTLPPGRYAVRLVVGPSGVPSEVTLSESPVPLARSAVTCLTAAFARLRFPGTAPPPPPLRVRVHGRYARVPPAHDRHDGGTVTIVWPSAIAAP